MVAFFELRGVPIAGLNWGRWPGAAGLLCNFSKPEVGGARLKQKAALVKMCGHWRQRVGPKAPGRSISPNLAATTRPRYRRQLGGGKSSHLLILLVDEIRT